MAVKSKAKAAQKDLYDNLSTIKDALSETKDGIKSRASDLISELLEDLRDQGTEYQDTVEEYVTDKPLKSVGIALAIGVIVGKFLL
jgi:ElaB/YqjD/DUF883 family membrane-anchored ribosome-binding protein